MFARLAPRPSTLLVLALDLWIRPSDVAGMEEPERVVLDGLDTPGGHLALVAYRGQEGVWIGVDRDSGGSMGARSSFTAAPSSLR